MIDRTGGVDKTLGVHINKTYKIKGVYPDGPAARRDALTISNFSALVEKGRACAMALPDIRTDRVSQARSAMAAGHSSTSSGCWGANDIASAIINGAAEGQR